eukprot:1610957-Heterocapsa_arctica.AAC.1
MPDNVVAVNGERIPVYGVKQMKVLLWGRIKADLLFHVMPVNLQVDFGQACCMKKEKKRIPLVAAGALFYLPILIEDGL